MPVSFTDKFLVLHSYQIVSEFHTKCEFVLQMMVASLDLRCAVEAREVFEANFPLFSPP